MGHIIKPNTFTPQTKILSAQVNTDFDVLYTQSNAHDDQITTLTADIAQRGLDIKSAPYNAVGDGVADDTAAFLAACSDAILSNTFLYLPKGSYWINKVADCNIPSIIGNYATIIVNDTYAFKCGSNCLLRGITFLTNKYYPVSSMTYTTILKQQATGQSNIVIENVKFIANLPATDGTQRSGYGINFAAVNRLKMDNVKFVGFCVAITVSGASNAIFGENICFENTQTGFFAVGSDSNQMVDMTNVTNIILNNIIHKNTATQAVNYTAVEGSDTVLLNRAMNVSITNVQAEFVVERVVYASMVKNLVATNFNLRECPMAVKFVGNQRNDTGLLDYGDGALFANISLRNETISDAIFSNFYFSKNIRVTGCKFYGNGIASQAFTLNHYVENLVIDNNTIEGLRRPMIYYLNIAGIPGSGSIPTNPEGNYSAYLKDIYIRDNVCKNINTYGYYSIWLDDQGTTLTSGSGGYRYLNIRIERNEIVNNANTVSGYDPAGTCYGLIDIKNVKGFRMSGNKIDGFKTQNDANGNRFAFPLQVGTNSYSVKVEHKEVIPSDLLTKKFVLGNMNVSSGSRLEFVLVDRLTNYVEDGRITPHISSTDQETIVDLNTKFSLFGSINVSHTGDDTTNIYGVAVTPYTLPNLVGRVTVDTGNGQGGIFTLNSSGNVVKNSSSDVIFDVNSSIAGKITVFKSAPFEYVVRNRSTAASRVIVNYNLTAI